MNNFKVLDTFKWGWEDFKKNFWLATLSFALMNFIGYIYSTNFLTNRITEASVDSNIGFDWSWKFILMSVVYFLVINYVSAGIYKEIIKTTGGERKFCLKNILLWPENTKHLMNYIGIGLVFLIPLSIFILPMFFVDKSNTMNILLLILAGLVTFLVIIYYTFFSYYLILENRAGVFESIKKSQAITKGNWWKITKFFLWTILFGLLGGFALGMISGLLMIIPVVGVFLGYFVQGIISVLIAYSFVHLYRQLDPEVENKKVSVDVPEEIVFEVGDENKKQD